jgi:arylsulfatase A-like enzyme
VAPEAKQAAARDAPDLALLLVAGLRTDTQGTDGATAALRQALPQPSIEYDQLYTQSSAPFSSVGSILTGRYPGAIPLCNRLLSGEHKKTEAQQAWCARLPDGIHTLAGMLGIYGYKSLLVSADFPGAQALSLGFSHHAEVGSWSEVAQEVEGWWAANADGPRLVVVLLGDGAKTVLGQPALQRFPEHRLQWLETVTPDVARVDLDPAEVRVAYKAGATAAGKVFGGVLSTVRGGQVRPAWSFVGSTSGMSLDERTGFGDAPVPLLTDNILLDRTLRVPLLVYGPEPGSRVSSEPVEGIDILATMASLAGAVTPAGASGTNLLNPAGRSGEAYAEFGDMIALRKGQYLLVFRCSLHNSTSLDPTITEQLQAPLESVPMGHYALYDVRVDPMQTKNLRRQAPEQVASMRKRMLAIRTGAAGVPAGTITPQRLWALRMAPSEGYW